MARDRVALILGRDGCLSAGFNLSTMRGDAGDRRNLVLAGLELALKLFESPVPVVVGCTGHAIAAGTLLLMTADRVVVGDRPVKIGLNETSIGIELSPFVLELARYRLLPSAYNQILQNLYDAEAAQLSGYVDEVVASHDLLPRSIEVANLFGKFRPAELPPDESGDEVEYNFGAAFSSRAQTFPIDPQPNGIGLRFAQHRPPLSENTLTKPGPLLAADEGLTHQIADNSPGLGSLTGRGPRRYGRRLPGRIAECCVRFGQIHQSERDGRLRRCVPRNRTTDRSI